MFIHQIYEMTYSSVLWKGQRPNPTLATRAVSPFVGGRHLCIQTPTFMARLPFFSRSIEISWAARCKDIALKGVKTGYGPGLHMLRASAYTDHLSPVLSPTALSKIELSSPWRSIKSCPLLAAIRKLGYSWPPIPNWARIETEKSRLLGTVLLYQIH